MNVWPLRAVIAAMRPARQGFAATDPGPRRHPQPGAEVLNEREGGEIRAGLRGNHQSAVDADGSCDTATSASIGGEGCLRLAPI